jgi:hypothetical protein
MSRKTFNARCCLGLEKKGRRGEEMELMLRKIIK